MKTFSDRWRQLDWDDIRLRINGKTAADVSTGAKCLATHPRRYDGAVIASRQWLSGTTGPTGAASDPSAIWQHS